MKLYFKAKGLVRWVAVSAAVVGLFGLVATTGAEAPSVQGPFYYFGNYHVGGENAYSVFWSPTSNHPSGWTYITLSKDADYLRVNVEVTGDNTDDAEDWTELTVGGTTYRIDDTHPEWGSCPFGSTDHVGYAHATCEFAIPLSAIPPRSFSFALKYYGTFTGANLQDSSDTGVSDSDNITSDTTPTFATSCMGEDFAFLYRDALTEGNHIDSAQCEDNTAILTDPEAPEGEHTYYVATDNDGDGLDWEEYSGGQDVIIDTTAPTVQSGSIGDNEATIIFSESVYGELCDFGGDCGVEETGELTVGVDDVREITGITVGGEGTKLVTLEFGGLPVGLADTATITLNRPPSDSIEDEAGNELEENTEVTLYGSVWVDDGYVDDDNDGDHDWEANAFDTIGEGLAAVPEHGTVYVAGGTYDEGDTTVLISTEGVSLIGSPGTNGDRGPGGEGTQILTACPGDPSMAINADDVTVQGFVFESSCEGPELYVAPEIEGAQILDNAFINSEIGIELSNGSSETTIAHNESEDHAVDIYDLGADDNTITDNEINVGIEFLCDDDDCDFYGTTVSDNDITSDGDTGISLNCDENSDCGMGVTISGNNIYENSYGIYLNCDEDAECDFDGTTISDNNIYDENEYGIYFECDYADECGFGGTTVSDNDIYDNGYGVYWDADDQESQVTIGPDNDIYDNCEGIYINANTTNLVITGNSIHDGDCDTSGLHINSGLDTNQLEAAGNWWGDASGPDVNEDGPGTSEDSETITNDSEEQVTIFYSPWCLDAQCEELSDADTDDVEGLFGTIFDTDGDDVDETDEVTVTSDVTITIGSSSVDIPAGTVITPTDDSTFDGTSLGGDTPDLSSLSGFSGTAKGALEWGASTGLTFDPAITLHINVGTALNGQTLQVKRSPDGGTTWTSDGIVPPATCTVTAGICTFQATKASTYVATTSGGGSSSGGIMPGSQLAKLLNLPSPTPTPTTAIETGPAAPPPFLFTLFMSRGMSGPAVKALQEKLKALGFFPADVDSTGYFGPITEAAVKAFQKAHGIDQVGFVGPRTRAALNK